MLNKELLFGVEPTFGTFTFKNGAYEEVQIELVNGSIIVVPRGTNTYSNKDVAKILPSRDAMNNSAENVEIQFGGPMGRYYIIADKSIDAYLWFTSDIM